MIPSPAPVFPAAILIHEHGTQAAQNAAPSNLGATLGSATLGSATLGSPTLDKERL
jgi:hypothetical protein